MHPAAITCPACQAPRDPQDAICGACGLLFSSYAPAGASPPHIPPPIVCPVCAQPSPAGASVCAACGGALLFSYTLLRVGQALSSGRYIIRRVISRGGMGAIYLATDRATFDRAVVVKAMLDYFDPSKPHELRAAQARFLQEAQTLAALRHPAIPQIFDYFQDGPHNYIVMEYVAGHDLDQGLTHIDDATGRRVAGRPYDREDVLRWGVALCRVLEYLASRQPHPVVHHDIKPANLLLDRNSGAVRLV